MDCKKPLTKPEIKLLCLVLNTSEYCYNTTTQLQEKIKEKIDKEFVDQVDFGSQIDAFMTYCFFFFSFFFSSSF